MFKSIGTKLLVGFFSVAAGPVLLVSLISYQANRRALEDQISGGLRALSNERARHIARMVQVRQEEAMEIAGAAVVRQLRPDGLNDPSTLRSIQDHVDWTYFEIKLKSLNPGADTGKGLPSEGQGAVFEGIEICDVEGVVVAGSSKDSIGEIMPSDYEKIARRSGSYFKGVTEDPRTHKVILTFLEKVRSSESQDFAGFVVLKVNGEVLNEIIAAPAGLGKTEEAYLINRDFFIMTRLKDQKEANRTLQKPAEAIVGCFGGEEKTAIYKNYSGVTVLGTTKRLSSRADQANQDWCLVHEIELEEAFAPVAALRRRIFLTSVILVFGVLGLAYLTSRSLSQPILSVRNAALEIAKGNTSVRTRVSSRDEIGELGEAFNRMTDRLVQSQQELARSNQDLEEFSYVASHDLQEPLRKITSYGDILQEDYSRELGAEGQESVRTMQKAAGRMQQLIEALLDYSRVTRKTRPLEPVPLGPMIKEVCSDLETALRESGGVVKAGPLPTIQADPIQMRQLFQNLIGNALKFSRKGTPPCVVIEAQVPDSGDSKISGNSGEVEISVIDNGIGFERKFAEKIFQPFQRLHTRDQYKGTGIGLSVCKKIVERHRGRISVVSEPGKGSAFTIRLPMV